MHGLPDTGQGGAGRARRPEPGRRPELFNGDGGRLDSQNRLSVLGGVLDNQGGALVPKAA
ncbi:hypothetical protein ACPA9J_17155 [Pseudomonas aeruginosa]